MADALSTESSSSSRSVSARRAAAAALVPGRLVRSGTSPLSTEVRTGSDVDTNIVCRRKQDSSRPTERSRRCGGASGLPRRLTPSRQAALDGWAVRPPRTDRARRAGLSAGSRRSDPGPARGRGSCVSTANAATVQAMEPVAAPLAAPEVTRDLDAESLDWLRRFAQTARSATRPWGDCTDCCCVPRASRSAADARHSRTSAATSSTTSPSEAADDALMSILRRLDDFRGASRFTTWAYKFALLEAVKLRKRAWQGREVLLEPEAWSFFTSGQLARGGGRAARAAHDAAACRRGCPHPRTSDGCSSPSR